MKSSTIAELLLLPSKLESYFGSALIKLKMQKSWQDRNHNLRGMKEVLQHHPMVSLL
jgi:hypothetical protein